jgi:hypothetical protein
MRFHTYRLTKKVLNEYEVFFWNGGRVKNENEIVFVLEDDGLANRKSCRHQLAHFCPKLRGGFFVFSDDISAWPR